jgi:hypothetical protein
MLLTEETETFVESLSHLQYILHKPQMKQSDIEPRPLHLKT